MRSEQKRDPLPSYFVNNDVLRIFGSRTPRDRGCRRNANSSRNRRQTGENERLQVGLDEL